MSREDDIDSPDRMNSADKRNSECFGNRGRMGGSRAGAGPGGQCRCPSCGTMLTHQVGLPCYQMECPQCKTPLERA
jgi:hypothetical protein